MSVYLCGELDPPEVQAWLQALRAALPEERIDTSLLSLDPATVDVVLVANPPPGQLKTFTSLRLIQSLWAGVDRLLADRTLPADVPLARMVDDSMSQAMAETALWAVLSLHRGFFDYAQQQRECRWAVLPQRRADELQVAVLGLGQLGRVVASRLLAQGYAVHGWRQGGRSAGPAAPAGVTVHAGLTALAPLLACSDIVVNLLPLTDDTRDLFDATRLAWMKPGAALINLARGAQVVEADLLAALDSGQLSRAVLDVFQREPLDVSHPFWAHPRVTVLPHAAALTDPRSAARVVAANVRALRRGQPLANLVDRRRGY
ncbi:MAG TPA: glyoxylate/hydroxypyruvate reductase A [Ideonella sp.]|uniref:2-hydroxyacid dehydrogenase n=1 Tax=Ideonella sp. TaxID=1929293 RepID=UPI002E3664D7|nr:glyoxylate/hydroxypyruvate reductase A [Ideonella sp.]HEX5686037.1 glyoxylate/hydroxypyruvate reductase A [Ideonella sp.]